MSISDPAKPLAMKSFNRGLVLTERFQANSTGVSFCVISNGSTDKVIWCREMNDLSAWMWKLISLAAYRIADMSV